MKKRKMLFSSGLIFICFTWTLNIMPNVGVASSKEWTGLWSPYGVAIGDYNNDGLNDIAFSEEGADKVTVYHSDGTTIIKQWTGLSTPYGVAIGDYNNDGLNDLAFAEYPAGRVTVYHSDGTTIIKQWTGLNYPHGIAIGDYNNDGLNDFAIAEYEAGKVTVYHSDGTTIIKQWTGLNYPHSVSIGDYNNDGSNDLAFSEAYGGRVTVYESDGTTVVKEWTGLDFPNGVAIGDYNNDGLNDLAFAERDAHLVTVYKSDGTTILKQWGPYPELWDPRGIAIGDYNNDGLNDFAITEDYPDTVTVYYGSPPPPNTPPVASNPYISPPYPKTTDDLHGDYNYSDADGDPESGTEIRWYKDGEPQAAYDDALTVPFSATAKGQTWQFSVRPSDGKDFGDLKWAPSVTIENTPPTADNPRISPLFPTNKDNLHAKWDYDDADDDPEVGSEIRWYKRVGDNHVPQPAYDDSYTVPYSATDWMEVWYFKVRPRDGQLFGVQKTSPEVKIGYRHIGVGTEETNDGIMAEIEVTDPAVQEGSQNFFTGWIMVSDQGSDPNDWKDDSWFQVGWMEHGNPSDVGTQPDNQYVFTEAYHGEWPWDPDNREFHSDFSISPGMSIRVKLEHAGTTWAAKLWWNGQWRLLRTATMEFSSPPQTHQAFEVRLAAHSPFYIPDTSFYNVELHIGGTWRTWNESYTSWEFDRDMEPYKAHWQNRYWSWYAYYSQASKLSVVAESPVNLLVTDPIGRRIGYDPENATIINEIPNATYSGPGTEPQNISIPDPLPGTYVVDAFGTGNGSYTIVMQSFTSNGSVIDIGGWNGTAVLGETYTENMTLNAEGQVAVPYDIAVADVTLSKSTIGQGHSMNLTVTIQNRGNYMESIVVTLYADKNATAIGDEITIKTQNLTLASGNFTTITFTWNTMGVPYGNYTISATASPLPYETETADNTYAGDTIMITIPGDINGDRVVDSTDQGMLGMAWGSIIGEPNYIPEADLNGDGVVDSTDYGILGANWGHSWS